MKPETRFFAIDGRYVQDHFPGIGRYTYNLIAALARVAPGEKFLVLHNPALRNTRYDIAALGRNANVELQRINVPAFSIREQWALARAMRAGSSPAPTGFHSPYFIKPYWLPLPSIVTIFDLIPIHYPDAIANAALRLVFRLVVSLSARTATRVIAPSVAVREDLIAYLRMPREKIGVVPLGIDARFAQQSDMEVARMREKYSLPHSYVLSVGINKPHKNLGTLIQAWERVQTEASLVIAGAWDARYEPRGLGAGRIRWIHNVEDADLPALYSGATVFVMPSLYEGFGLPLLEAMACGAPVIASNTSSLPEVVGDAALMFDPRDANMLAALLARVLSDRSLRDELRAKSLARAKEFSWERTARETLAVYCTAAARYKS